MKKVNIGLIGAGLIANQHSFALHQAANIGGLPLSLAAVADLDFAKAEKFSRIYGFAHAFADPEQIFDDPEINAVYICTPTRYHAELVKAAAKAGKHVFCEKPLAFTAAAAEEMLLAVQKAGVIHQVGLVLRHAPVWNALRVLAARPENGMPISLIFRDDQCFPIKGGHPSTWRKDVEMAGGGTLIEHSIHDLDLMEYIFGRIVKVQAHTRHNYGYRGVEDMAQVLIEFESNMTGVLISVWHDVLHRHSNRRIEVFYANAFIAHECEFSGPIDLMETDRSMKTVSEKEVLNMYWRECQVDDHAERKLSQMFGCLEDYLFCKSVLEGRPANPDLSVGVRGHVLVDACYKSAHDGKAVSVK